MQRFELTAVALALSYNSLALSWAPRPDGRILTASPHQLASEGKIANVPVIIGDMKDEGTLFSLATQLNVTTDEAFKEYFQNIWWPNATDAQLARLMELYPADPTQGSPFDGLANAISPQYKRLAALIGDYSFQVSRIPPIGRVLPVVANAFLRSSLNVGNLLRILLQHRRRGHITPKRLYPSLARFL